MTLKQEASQMINTMPDDSVCILIELMKRMIPSKGKTSSERNVSEYYGVLHMNVDGLNLQKELRDELL